MQHTEEWEKLKRRFFALSTELGYSNEDMKERAKTKFQLNSFNDATEAQLKWLVAQLVHKKNRKLDDKIIAAGFDITVCVHCGEDCVVQGDVAEAPCCYRLYCVRKAFEYGG